MKIAKARIYFEPVRMWEWSENMFIKELKESMLLPQEEILINRRVYIRGIPAHIISLTKEKHRNALWVLYEGASGSSEEMEDIYEIDGEERIGNKTNRQDIVDPMHRERNARNIGFISEITIQNQKLIFTSSQGYHLHDRHYEGYMQLQHFIEKGLDLEGLNEINVNNLVIQCYAQDENPEFPEIDLSKALDITLKIGSDFKRELMDPPMASIQLRFKEYEKEHKFSFFDPVENENIEFYINKMEHYDVWEETKKRVEKEWPKIASKDEIEQIKGELFDTIEQICPKGMDLAIMEYESEKDVQLNFYTTEYLDSKPIHRSSSVGMIFSPENKLGQNGFTNRICMLKPVAKDFNEAIEIELLYWFREIPEEIIHI
ncbi:hypothetical protein [Alkaliphilus oremlandii]|nr:hypothetical protein [Alkaliphilus oremlandii]